MSRNNSLPPNKELVELITNYETAKAENRQLYMDGDQLVALTDWYATNQDFAEAQDVITYGLNLHPGNTELLIEQAYIYLDTHNLQKAKKIAATINEEYTFEVKMLKAELLLNEGKLKEARRLLNTIEEIDDLGTLTDIVYLFLDLGYPESAQEWLEKGKSQYAEEQDYLVLMADYLSATHQNKAAIEVYNKLIDAVPYNASYWMGLAKCYFSEEQIEKMIEACDFALAADEQYGEAYAYKAHGFFYLNNPDKAIEYYEKAIEYNSFPPELGCMFMGLSYINKEEWQKADDCYTKVIECFEKDADTASFLLIDIYTNKAVALSHLGKLKEAHQLCNKARNLDPNEGTVYLTDGKIYLTEELVEQASKAFKKALELKYDVEMAYMIASAYSDNDYLDEAKEYYEIVYKLNPKYESVAEKLSALSLMNYEMEKFFMYNSECNNPIDQDTILELLANPDHRKEDEQVLKEVLARMEKESKKKKGN